MKLFPAHFVLLSQLLSIMTGHCWPSKVILKKYFIYFSCAYRSLPARNEEEGHLMRQKIPGIGKDKKAANIIKLLHVCHRVKPAQMYHSEKMTFWLYLLCSCSLDDPGMCWEPKQGIGNCYGGVIPEGLDYTCSALNELGMRWRETQSSDEEFRIHLGWEDRRWQWSRQHCF